MIAQPHFRLDFVAVGNSHIVHLVAETDYAHILRIGPSSGHPHPHGDFGLCLGVLPVAYDHFTVFTHTGNDVPEFAVSVC